MRRSLWVAVYSASIAAIGSILFGYQLSIISGVLPFLAQEFRLSLFQQQLFVSAILVGATLGSLFGGLITDWLGRKRSLFLTAILFAFASWMLGNADSYSMLLFGRWLAGVALGLVAVATPLYITEIAPPEHRGALVSFNQLAITIGIFAGYLASSYHAAAGAWREMFTVGFFPALGQFFLLFFISETEAWKTRPQSKETPLWHSWRALFQPPLRRALWVGLSIAAIQQITGINIVIYYAPQILQLAGYPTMELAMSIVTWMGAVNVFMTLVALWLLDRWGRRPLLLAGLSGMTLSLVILGLFLSDYVPQFKEVPALMLLCYVSSFALSLGPIFWLLQTEIYPLEVRGQAASLGIFVNWLCNIIVAATFLSLMNWFGAIYILWFYGAICLLSLLFVWKKVPETKGKSVVEIQSLWR